MSLKLFAKLTDDEAKHANDVVCLLYNNGLLISGADDGKIKIWTSDLKPVASIDAHPVNVYSVAVVGDTLYSCSNDGTLKAWNIGTWDLKKNLLENQQSEIIKVVSDQGRLYAGNEQGDVFVFENDELFATYYLHEDIADILVIGNLVFNARNVDVSVTEMMPGPRFGYMSRGAMIGRFPVRKVGDKVCFLSRCAKQVYVHHSTKEEKFKRVAEIKAHDMTISAMTHVPGKEHIMVSGGYDRVLKAWDINTKKMLAKVDLGVCINDICPGDEGKLYVSSSEGYICMVDALF
ncbi:uncharacterized protein LOC106668536 [Cimex lectularius]|uniref:Uncharacterized protein n=1 Tax=Cimex lectularius TaxID=79782 RepID=A0A8I6RWZ7_CIMLE|nr:uncharacterized protein LOC106668536 [Cimex lectularius]